MSTTTTATDLSQLSGPDLEDLTKATWASIGRLQRGVAALTQQLDVADLRAELDPTKASARDEIKEQINAAMTRIGEHEATLKAVAAREEAIRLEIEREGCAAVERTLDEAAQAAAALDRLLWAAGEAYGLTLSTYGRAVEEAKPFINQGVISAVSGILYFEDLAKYRFHRAGGPEADAIAGFGHQNVPTLTELIVQSGAKLVTRLPHNSYKAPDPEPEPEPDPEPIAEAAE